MATHKSAEKRARQSEKRRLRNHSVRSATRTVLRKAAESIQNAHSQEEALKALQLGERALQKAASKGVIPKERASRKTSRLIRLLKKKFQKQDSAQASSAR